VTVFKKGNSRHVARYISVSILNNTSKDFETVTNDQLFSYFKYAMHPCPQCIHAI
jgi:hypothetical protein